MMGLAYTIKNALTLPGSHSSSWCPNGLLHRLWPASLRPRTNKPRHRPSCLREWPKEGSTQSLYKQPLVTRSVPRPHLPDSLAEATAGRPCRLLEGRPRPWKEKRDTSPHTRLLLLAHSQFVVICSLMFIVRNTFPFNAHLVTHTSVLELQKPLHGWHCYHIHTVVSCIARPLLGIWMCERAQSHKHAHWRGQRWQSGP